MLLVGLLARIIRIDMALKSLPKKRKPASMSIQKVEATRIVVNSLDDLNRLHETEMADRRTNRANQLAQAVSAMEAMHAPRGAGRGPLTNAGLSDAVRSSWFNFLLDGPKDIDAECGYPHWLTPDHYRLMYDREGIAKRVVECEPEETWSEDPQVYEDEDEGTETKFEKAWDALVKKFNLYHYLQRIDVLSGIGQYGILLIGIDDGQNLMEPVDGISDDGTGVSSNDHELLYLRPFSEEVVFVKMREVDTTSARYGQPTMYTIQFRDFPNWGIQAGEIIARDVHWTRVIHVADNRKISEVYGLPRMQQVWNRLYDLRKIYSSAGEAFWKGAFPGLAFELNPEIADQGEPLDKEGLKKEMDAYSQGLQRYIAVTGLTTKSLPPMITDPSSTAECMLKAIAIAKGVPYRILFGSEEAKLAGAQDDKHWNKKLGKRQEKYVTPMLIRPFVDRLMAMGVLPQVDEYDVSWPDLDTPSDADKATLALQITQAMQAYVQGGVDALIPPMQFLTMVLDFTTEEAQAIMDAAGEHLDDSEGMDDEAENDPGDEADAETGEGGLGGTSPANEADALNQQDLSGRTTIPKNKKAVGAQFVQLPSLNRKTSRKHIKAILKPKPVKKTRRRAA